MTQSNLMLLCPQCHKLIDDHPTVPVSVCRNHKDSTRIAVSTSPVRPDQNGRRGCASRPALQDGPSRHFPVSAGTKAVASSYVHGLQGPSLSSYGNQLGGKGLHQRRRAGCIKQASNLYEPAWDDHETRHISLLRSRRLAADLTGSQLATKVTGSMSIPGTATQEDWFCKDSGTRAELQVEKIRRGRASRISP